MSKKLLIPVVLGLVLALAAAGVVLAQSATPGATPAPNAPAKTPGFRFGFGFNFFGGGANNWSAFDTVAKTLKLTPDELFQQLHGGKTLAQIAQAQGVDLSAVQTALQTARTDEMRAAINAAVQAGKITQDQANWLLQGLDKGYLGKGGMGPGMMAPGVGPGMMGPGAAGKFHGFGRGGMRGNTTPAQPNQPQAQPTPTL